MNATRYNQIFSRLNTRSKGSTEYPHNLTTDLEYEGMIRELLEVVRPHVEPALSKAALDKEVKRLVGLGQKVPAIKLYRRETSLGLKESKDYVENLCSSVKQKKNAGVGAYLDGTILNTEIRKYATAGKLGGKISAIKFCREYSGWTLKESKDYVEALVPLWNVAPLTRKQVARVVASGRKSARVFKQANVSRKKTRKKVRLRHRAAPKGK